MTKQQRKCRHSYLTKHRLNQHKSSIAKSSLFLSFSTVPKMADQLKTWPNPSNSTPYASLPFSTHNPFLKTRKFLSSSPNPNPNCNPNNNYSNLPYDILTKIASTFKQPALFSASSVCKAWHEALKPLREAMLLLKWGKRFKHGKGGVKLDLEKALDSFLRAAAKGSTLAMVDAGLMYWEMGKKEEGIELYLKAAELGDPAGQCNLGISYLQLEPPNPKEAVNWLYKASVAGHVRAQYQLALCLHQGSGASRSLREAAKWYLKAAEGGYVRAMYNVSMCYSVGEGLRHSSRRSRAWMKRAADHGHHKAQYELGLRLFSEGEKMEACVFLELATRAGETAASHVKDAVFQQLSETQRARVIHLVNNWRALPSSR